MSKELKRTPEVRMVTVDGVEYQLIDGRLYRYADVTLDKGFKIVFGRVGSEEVLRNMLNRLLGIHIRKLEYRNTEHPGMTEEERSSRFDVYCEDDNGNAFQVEMQNWSQKYYHKRAVFYSSLVLVDQAEKARRLYQEQSSEKSRKSWDYDYRPLFVVSFLNFSNWTTQNGDSKAVPWLSTYRYTDVETKDELGDGTNIVFIDLHGFSKSLEECTSLEDMWMYSIKNMGEQTSCPEAAKGTEIEDLYRKSELAKMTYEQRKRIEEDIMTQNDILNSIREQLEDGKEKAMAEGREQGLAEGREAAIEEMVRKMLAAGLSAEQVAEIAEMSVEDVARMCC